MTAATAAALALQSGADDAQLLQEKFRLLEQDRKQYFDTSQNQLKVNRNLIKALRQENKSLQGTIMTAKRGAGSVLDKEARQLDDGIYKATMKLDSIREEIARRRGGLTHLKETLREVATEAEPLLDEDHPLTRKIRLLENRLDKSLIKYNEAVSIKKTYEQIVQRLRDERVGFDNQLSAIERTLKAKDHDYQELLKMSHDANHAKEVARKELQDFKKSFDLESQTKDRELQERRTYVQAKVEQTQKLERKEKMLRQQEQDEARQRLEDEQLLQHGGGGQKGRGDASGGDATVEEEERLAQYETAFRAIKDATGVADVNDVLQRFVAQQETSRTLRSMVHDAQEKLNQLNTEKGELISRLEELRYSGSGQLGSRRIVEEFDLHLQEATNQSGLNAERYERLAKLLIDVKGGVEHLMEKLAVFRPEITPPSLSDESLVECLKHCEQKLTNLAEEVLPSDDQENALVTAALDLPSYNRRVKLPASGGGDGGGTDGEDGTDGDGGDEAAMFAEQDDDAVLKRDQVKKISANSIQRETKKLKRKRRDK